MISVYEERGIEKGILEGKRQILLRQLGTKFGTVSPEIAARIQRIADSSELDKLSDRLLTARSVQEMGLA